MPNKSRYEKEVSRKFIQLARDFRFNKIILGVELCSIFNHLNLLFESHFPYKKDDLNIHISHFIWSLC